MKNQEKKMIYKRPCPVIPFPTNIRFNKKLTFGERIFLAEMLIMAREPIPLCRKSLGTRFGVCQITIRNWIEHLTKLRMLEVKTESINDEHSEFIVATSQSQEETKTSILSSSGI